MSPRPSKSSRRRRCSEGVARLAASLAECDAGKPSNFGTKTMPQCCIPAAVLLPLPPRTHALVRLWYTLTPRGAACGVNNGQTVAGGTTWRGTDKAWLERRRDAMMTPRRRPPTTTTARAMRPCAMGPCRGAARRRRKSRSRAINLCSANSHSHLCIIGQVSQCRRAAVPSVKGAFRALFLHILLHKEGLGAGWRGNK